jgi:hypothetical protein
MLRRAFPTLKRPDVEFVLDCTSFIFFPVIFLHLLVCDGAPFCMNSRDAPCPLRTRLIGFTPKFVENR